MEKPIYFKIAEKCFWSIMKQLNNINKMSRNNSNENTRNVELNLTQNFIFTYINLLEKFKANR